MYNLEEKLNNTLQKKIIITTIAGTGISGYNGDNMLATSAQLRNPSGVIVDSNGEILIADTGNNRICKLLTNGLITTIAGTGTYGYNGDNILAKAAQLNNPSDITVTSNGEIYIADYGNHRIRKILTNGTIITIAGTGTAGYNGDNILATSAQLRGPFSVIVDSNGEIYITDTINNRIRKILTNGTIITIAGTGVQGYNGENILTVEAQLSYPYGVAVKPNGEILVTTGNYLRLISTIACDGVNNCNGHGDCIGANLCQCFSGYKGPSCSEFSCSEFEECNGKGSCTGPNECTCNSGWKGNNECTISSCDGLSNCTGHGICIGPNTCVCDSGWKGSEDCSLPSCDDVNNCTGHGICTGANQCNCDSGWKGDIFCNSFTCEGINNCNGEGICSGPNTCDCNSGWKGNNDCSTLSCDALNNCNSNGVCTSSNTCTCNSGWKGNAQCSQYSCEAVNNCVGNGNCIGPNTCSGSSSAECQTGWKSNTFGAPKPTITTSYNSDSKKFILNIEMFKNDLPDQNTFNSLTLTNTGNLDNSNCQTSDSNNSPFSVVSDGKCSKKYEYQFDTVELGSSKNFVGSVSLDGNSLIYSSYITTSYSSNDVNTSICSLYQFTTKVQYQLSLVASQTEFTSVDNIGKFIVKRLYINSDKKFVLEGRLSRVFDKVSSFQDITLTKQNAPTLTLSQSSSISCGSTCYNLIFTSDQIASESLDDTYKLQFKMSELPSDSNIPIMENTRTLSIDIAVQYTVPDDPSIISGSEITSSITLYNSNDALSRPLISYSTNDKLFLGNAINDVNIVLPTNTKFSPLNAKVCCVPSATAFPSTGCSSSGHSAFADLVVNKVVQQNVDVAIEGQDLNSKTANSKEYYLQFLIKDKLSNIPTSAQTCRIYIESTFQTVNSRNVESNQLFSTTVVKSQSQFSIVDDTTTEREEIMTGTLITNNYYSIITSSVIVGSGLLLSLVTAILAIVYVYFQKKKKNSVNNIVDQTVTV